LVPLKKMSHLPQNSALYAPQIYAPSIQSNQTHGYLKAIHLPREVYSEHHLQIPHEIYPDEIVRTHSCPSVQTVEVRFLASIRANLVRDRYELSMKFHKDQKI
jgi:hypothetical protein